jgi:hypothetical protein
MMNYQRNRVRLTDFRWIWLTWTAFEDDAIYHWLSQIAIKPIVLFIEKT